MDLRDIFEYPLPIIQVDTEKIAINMNDFNGGLINIKNIGGGNLMGKIFSNTDCIILHEEEFEGNNISVEYEIVPSIYNSGDFIKSEIIILSNGGEVVIPIFIAISNFDYLLCIREKIYTIKEFYNYYLKNTKEAIRIFNSFEFMIWLKKIDFMHIDITEVFLKDANKQRGIDNFFIIAGVKEKATLDFEETTYKYKYFNKNESDIVGIIPLKMIGKGYFEEDIFLQKECDWLILETNKIFNKDFDELGNYNLNFKIIKSKLKKGFEKNKIMFGKNQKSIGIEICKKQPIQIVCEREYYETIDTGNIKVINNLGEDLLIEILPKDTFINFEGEKYLVGKYAEIKFNIKLTGFLKAQLDFIKKPYMDTEILIKAQFGDKIFKDKKIIHIGNSFI